VSSAIRDDNLVQRRLMTRDKSQIADNISRSRVPTWDVQASAKRSPGGFTLPLVAERRALGDTEASL